MARMKKCPKCGKENIDEERFCTWCRAELPVTVEKKKNDTGRIVAIVILIVAICACLVGVFMLFKDENSGNNQGENIAQKEGSSQADNDISAEKKISGVYLAPFMNEEGKWGYINTDGEVVIECKYDLAYEFDEEGYAVVGMETDSDASEYYTIDKVIATEKTTGNKITITDNKFAMPDDDVVVTATFKKQQFTVTKAATENGTITIVAPEPGSDGNVTLDWGKTVKINVKADNFYEIATVTVGGSTVDVDINGDYSFEMPKNDTTISATFKKVKYTITGQGDNVTFDIPSSDTYNWGDIVEFTVTPAQWYTIDSVTIPNIEITDKGNGKYSFVMPSRNVTITVIASKPMHTITFDTKGGNAVQSVTVANGDSFEKTIPTWAGRGFAGWYLDENYENKYDFSTPVEKSMTLYARWFLWGDVNGDQEIDSYDAALIRRCMVGLAPYDKMTQRIAGFVTGFADGRSNPDSSDAATIRRLCVGLITRFKVEDEKAGCEFDLDTNSIVNN